MTVRSLFLSAAVVAVVAVVTIALIVLPQSVWSPSAIGSLILLAGAVGVSLYPPLRQQQRGSAGDAATIASVGPLGAIVIGTLAWSVATFAVALTGRHTISWAMMVATLTGFTIATLLLRATTNIVDSVAKSTASPSSMTRWRSQVEAMAATAGHSDTRVALGRLAEKFRFSASGLPIEPSEINGQIEEILAAARELCRPNGAEGEQLHACISELSRLLDQRNAELKAARNKA